MNPETGVYILRRKIIAETRNRSYKHKETNRKPGCQGNVAKNYQRRTENYKTEIITNCYCNYGPETGVVRRNKVITLMSYPDRDIQVFQTCERISPNISYY